MFKRGVLLLIPVVWAGEVKSPVSVAPEADGLSRAFVAKDSIE